MQSVVADEAFWDRQTTPGVLVRLRPSGESSQRVRAGQRVDFTARVVGNGDDLAARLGVDADQGAGLLGEQGRTWRPPRCG